MCQWGDIEPVELIQDASISHNGEDTRKVVQVDRCLAPIIRALNSHGIRTLGCCCCGHGKTEGSIRLKDGRELIVRAWK